MPTPPEYGIIYNWDGAPHSYSEVPQSMESYLEKTYSPLENTQVGAHFWSVRDHDSFGESDPADLVPQNAGGHIGGENLRLMMKRGEDPYEALVKRGHELGLHVFASMRMNDNHFGGAQVADLGEMGDTARVRVRREHPEWLLGGYVKRCVNDIRRRPSQPLIQWRFHPHTVHRDRRLRSTQGPSDA